ncbi:MAG: O-antigen ligase family protein [Bacteroidales bacterium]|nr:O-antigen ligase family protein [Bacteroidales bacterium]
MSLSKRDIIGVYVAVLMFLALSTYFVAKNQFVFLLAPFALVFLFVAIFALDKLLLFIVFSTPISLQLSEFVSGLPINMFLPTEPLLFGILLLFILKIIVGRDIDISILKHPISIIIYIQLAWMLLTAFTSTMFFVSIKYFLARLWFVVGFYILAAHLFKNQKNIGRYIWLYVSTLIIVIGYALYRQYQHGLFDQQFANSAPNPLYNDHTAYAAALAMILPFMVGLLFLKQYSYWQKIVAFIVLFIVIVGLVFSYTRAAWLSLVVAFIAFIILLFKIKFRTIVILLVSFGLILSLIWTQLIMKLERNKQDASSNFTEQIQSVTNISTDASNLERLNRWSCAYRMFLDKPILGWGPGTYMFKYAPYQLSYQRTIISTNFGEVGNAHSEYLGPLAEQGILGLVLMLILVFTTLYYAVNLYRKSTERNVKIIILSATIGLITYYVHGLLNNFLDTDKLSALFWAYTAIIVVFDIQYRNQTQLKDLTNSQK